MITNKFTAYGLTVAVAFAAAVVLLLATAPLSASADKGTTADGSATISNVAGGVELTLSATQVSGKVACDEGMFAVSSPVGGTAAAPDDKDCETLSTTVSAVGLVGDTTLTVVSTKGFPTSGSLIMENDGNEDLADGDIEIVDYTGKTATSFTGVTRARAGTTALAPAVGANLWPVVYVQITIAPTARMDLTVNVTDAGGLVVGGTTGADLIIDPSSSGIGQQIREVRAKSGNTLTLATNFDVIHDVGEYIAQINGVNRDSATSDFTRTASTTTEGSVKFTLLANGQKSTAGTMSLTIVSDSPDAADAEVTVSATTPVALPIIVGLAGSDSSEVALNSAFGFTKLPTKGILTAPTAALCTNVTGAVIGEVMTNCLGQTVYTALLGATGTDSFEYTLLNHGETSAAATVTIILPGGTPTPTPGAGFTDALVAGVNLTTYRGGTVLQLATDAAAAGATSVSVTSAGAFIVHVVGAPDFVNAAFAANFPDDVPSGQVVLVLVSS